MFASRGVQAMLLQVGPGLPSLSRQCCTNGLGHNAQARMPQDLLIKAIKDFYRMSLRPSHNGATACREHKQQICWLPALKQKTLPEVCLQSCGRAHLLEHLAGSYRKGPSLSASRVALDLPESPAPHPPYASSAGAVVQGLYYCSATSSRPACSNTSMKGILILLEALKCVRNC